MRFQLLGPLRVWDGANWLSVRADQQRVVLAVLLIEAGQRVSVERLLDELWGQQPPRAAVSVVQGYVMRLRRLLGAGAAGLLVTRRHGYELLAGDGDLDTQAYDRLVAAGRADLAAGRAEAAGARLAEALTLWRGPPLADVPAVPAVAGYTARLEQSRLGVLEDRLATRLELDGPAEVIAELRRLAAEHPLRERLWQQLMLALYRDGRRAEALLAYREARGRLAGELGTEPGARLRELHQAILTDDPTLLGPREAAAPPGLAPPAGPVVPAGAVVPAGSVVPAGATIPAGVLAAPAQLPAEVSGFTGRAAAVAALDGLLADGDGAAPVMALAAVAGAAGVGKTALAVHWAHRVRARFPDGQLYANLRGHSAGPAVHPAEALARFLLALGVPAAEVPTDLEAAAAAYRSLLAGRRMLVLLDDAASADQVRPLLPGSPGSLVLVTSRDWLRGLIARDGASSVRLEALTPAEAEALLGRLLGADRAAAEPRAVAELAALCGRQPLALRIAAANAISRPQPALADYVAGLAAGDRLAALQVDGDPEAAVRTAFDHSYAALPADARRLFRLLGLLPGADFGVAGAAALLDTTARTAGRLLRRLADAHLVEERDPGRYSCHDLLSLFAAELAAADEDGAGQPALDRLYAYYQRHVDAAGTELYPQIVRLPAAPPAAPVQFGGHVPALAWLDSERASMVAAVRQAAGSEPRLAAGSEPRLAAGSEPRQVAWQLADGLRGYLTLGNHAVDWQEVAGAALVAAEADGSVTGQAAAHLSLATLSAFRSRYADAVEHYTACLALAQRSGWSQAHAAALGNLGGVYRELGNIRLAAGCYTRALAADRAAGRRGTQATKIANLGLVYVEMGDLARAAEHLEEALALHREHGSPSGEAMSLTSLGEVRHGQGRLAEALATLTRALELHRTIRSADSTTTTLLAAVHRDTGRTAEALELARAAVQLTRDDADRRAESYALNMLGTIELHLGRPGAAIASHQQALALARAARTRYGETEVLAGLAAAHHCAGHLAEAAEIAAAGVASARTADYRVLAGLALTVQAAVQLCRGRYEQAAEEAGQALAIQAGTGHRLGQARAHLVLAAALTAAGQPGPGRGHRDQAGALLAEIGAPWAEQSRLTLGPAAG